MDKSLTIIRRSVKHARLRVRQDSSVELIVPQDWQSNEIDRLLDKKTAWIHEKKNFFLMRERSRPYLACNEVILFGKPFRIESEERLEDTEDFHLRAWQREFAKTYLSKRTNELSEKHGLNYRRLFVRSQQTKWGSCSAKGNISLNWRLISVPERVIDYVILHELLHTKVMNHSQAFWVHLHAICPWAKEAIAWLNVYQPESELKVSP